MNRYLISTIVFVFISLFIVSGQEDDILLTIGDRKISREEFERIYKKNNSSPVYDHKSVEEYLQLFINFKLKVIEAENLGYDTIQSFITELAGYREQLAKPYLEDKELDEMLLQEAYFRTINEISASHILIRLNQDVSPSDTLMIFNKIMKLRDRILKGESFADVAKAESEDPSAQNNGGFLGWFSAFQMIYPFETAAYNTKPGEISMPVRTRFGYHIIKVENTRPAMGKVRIAHILILGSEQDADARQLGETRVKECYERILDGEDFGSLAAEYSEDKNTSSNGGDLNWIRSGIIPVNLESVIFNLKDSGDITKPLPTEYGWHIFKLLGKSPIESFETMKPDLERKISRENRNTQNENILVERIKKENNFKFYKQNLNPVINLLDESLYEGLWDPSLADEMSDPVISFNHKDYTQKDFAYYLASMKTYNKGYKPEEIVNERIQRFIHTKAIEYEKSMLETKHPEFKNLMEEYHDGILLFNLTDDLVWSKAMKDTTGLKGFYEKNKNNYMWEERISISTYTYQDSTLTNKILKAAKKRIKNPIPAGRFQALVCKSDTVICVQVEDKKLEKEDAKKLAGLVWQKGFILQKKDQGKFSSIVVNGIISPEPKKLNEAKGLITADYQTVLETEWIKSLREKYSVEVNQEVLNKISQ